MDQHNDADGRAFYDNGMGLVMELRTKFSNLLARYRAVGRNWYNMPSSLTHTQAIVSARAQECFEAFSSNDMITSREDHIFGKIRKADWYLQAAVPLIEAGETNVSEQIIGLANMAIDAMQEQLETLEAAVSRLLDLQDDTEDPPFSLLVRAADLVDWEESIPVPHFERGEANAQRDDA